MAKKNETETASVAPTEGNVKRSIQMKMFVGATDKATVALAKATPGSPVDQHSKTLGQIVGEIYEVRERRWENKDGSVQVTLQALGDFEAVVYETGEVLSSGVADLPKYYLEGLKAILDKGERMGLGSSLVIAVEIVLVATGKEIPVAYEVRNLIQRRPESRINALKAELSGSGRLRLPPPVAVPQQAVAIEHQPEPETEHEAA